MRAPFTRRLFCDGDQAAMSTLAMAAQASINANNCLRIFEIGRKLCLSCRPSPLRFLWLRLPHFPLTPIRPMHNSRRFHWLDLKKNRGGPSSIITVTFWPRIDRSGLTPARHPTRAPSRLFVAVFFPTTSSRRQALRQSCSTIPVFPFLGAPAEHSPSPTLPKTARKAADRSW
jgi:hypothetical protein